MGAESVCFRVRLYMQIEWFFLVLAAVLLLPPMPMAQSLRRFVLKSRRNASASITDMLGPWQNWADVARATAGVYVLMVLAVKVDPEIEGAALKALVLQGGTLAIGVVVQSIRYSGELRIVAPVFYLSGITLLLPGLTTGGFAVFTGWLFAVGSQSPKYSLPIMGIAAAAGGYVLGNLGLPLILNCGLIFLPMFLAFMARQPLVFVAREPVRQPITA